MATTTAVPAPAAAVGYDTQTFGPAVTLGSNWQKFNFFGVDPGSVGVTQNADGSVTIAGGGDNYGAQLSTASVGSTPHSFTGIAFGGGGYFQAVMSFTGPASFWANDIETMDGISTGAGPNQWPGQAAGYGDWIEADFAEFDATGVYGLGIHNWFGAVGSGNDTNTGPISGSPVFPPGANYTQPNTYGFLWVPATTTTQGYAKFYFNGVQVGNTITWNQYNPSAGPVPSIGNGTAFSVLDKLHLALILGTGSTGTSNTVYSVSVWQNSSVGDISTLPAAATAPPSLTSSPNGTSITSASASPIIDKSGNAWTLVQSTSNGLQIAVNGIVDAITAKVVLLETLNGAMVQENSSGSWYSETTPNDSWTQIANPNPTSSPNGTSITSASASPIIDQNGNAWSLVQSASNGLQIAVNGTVDAPTANVVLLETLNGAMIQENSAGNWYSETTPNDSWVQIANPAPVVSTITTSPGSGDLTVGATVTLTVTFSSAVTVAGGTPTLALNDGGVATYVSGSGSSTLVFKYTVAAGQNISDLTSAASSAITLNGATIRGASGINAVLTGANGYNPAGTLQIDTTAPKLSAIATSPGSGQVATGGTVTLTATFSEAVTVAGGTPTLALNDGGTATYLSGSGSSALAFKYTVAAGQSTTDLKLAASNAVALNGGTIRDAAGNNAVLTGANGYTPAGTLAINPPASPPATNDFLIMPGSGTFKDAAGNTYSLDSWQNAIENGKDIPGGGGTSAMAYFNGTVLGQDAGGTGWYTWNQSNWQPDAPNVSDVTSAGTLTKNLSQTGTFAENGDTFVLSSGNVLKATLGSGNDNVGFIGPQQVVLTGGSGTATVLAAGGNNTFTAGSGSLDVTAGTGKDAYVFHTTSGLLTLEDFSLAKGDTLTIDKALQGSLHQASDRAGGTMLTFGTNTSHGVDIHGVAALPSNNILWA